MSIIKTDNRLATANKIVNIFAGSPSELQRQFKANNLRYVKVRKGGLVKFVVRGINDNFKTVIRL
jgi:hypothetical protein